MKKYFMTDSKIMNIFLKKLNIDNDGIGLWERLRNLRIKSLQNEKTSKKDKNNFKKF